ncbi:MAG: hypothetical protein Kow0032_00900 [Methyloligellaceae bacterium]
MVKPGPLGPVDWPWVMALGLGVLRLPPAQFWAMTPRELHAAASLLFAPGRQAAPGRADLAALMHRYPDAAAPERSKEIDGHG